MQPFRAQRSIPQVAVAKARFTAGHRLVFEGNPEAVWLGLKTPSDEEAASAWAM